MAAGTGQRSGRSAAAGALAPLMAIALAGGCTTLDAKDTGPENDSGKRQSQWTVRPTEKYGPIVTAQAIDTSVVVVFESAIAVLDRKTGKERWSVAAAFPSNLQPAEQSVRVTADALVLLQEPDTRDEPGTATVYDLASGEQRASLDYGNSPDYRSAGVARFSVTADTLLVEHAESTGSGQDERHTLESVDLRTGRPLWKQDYGDLFPLIQPSTQTANPLFVPPPRDPLLAPDTTLVALRGYETVGESHEYRTRIVDPRTGRTVGGPATTPQQSAVTLLDDKRYVEWDDDSEDCGTRVNGYDAASAKPAWHLEAAAWRNGAKHECVDIWTPLVVEHHLLTHTPDEQPILVNPSDGKPTWTGPKGFYPIGVSGDVVVGRDSTKDDTVVAYDVSDFRQLWTAPDPGGIQNESDTVVRGYAIFASGSDEVWTYQLNTGMKLRCAGANHIIAAGDGWLVAGLRGDSLDDGKRALRYFAL